MKVLILGGGPAGCAAAYFLKQLGINDITLIEKEAIGGCARTNFYDSIPYEFGPQILYTDEHQIREVFKKFVENKAAPTEDGEYHPKVIINGNLEKPHDFPVTIANVLMSDTPIKIIYELYKLRLDQPDFSNFENYMLSRIGRTLYETYVKNYNIKMWKVDPKELDAEWAKERTLTLREKNDMFQGRWQGHPGNHNPIWEGMVRGIKFEKGEACVSESFKKVYVDGKSRERGYDLIISTLPLSNKLPYMHTLKVYVVIKEDKFIMPSYINSFPNNYDFIRIMEYKQQFYVKSDYSLLDFAFSWNDDTGIDVNKSVEEVRWFCKNILKRKIKDLFFINKTYTYPVSTLSIRKIIDNKLKTAADTKVIPIGRCGLHAYVSKDLCVRMGLIMKNHFNEVLQKGSKKLQVLRRMREKLR